MPVVTVTVVAAAEYGADERLAAQGRRGLDHRLLFRYPYSDAAAIKEEGRPTDGPPRLIGEQQESGARTVPLSCLKEISVKKCQFLNYSASMPS